MDRKEYILVSACLLGFCCRYDGQERACGKITELMEHFHLIPVCPEQLGGLKTPRKPAERVGNKVLACDGEDVTKAYVKGGQEVLKAAKLYGCRYAVLKEKSPSCGQGCIYDGTFTRTLTKGDGVTAALLKENGIKVLGESEADRLLQDVCSGENTSEKENKQNEDNSSYERKGFGAVKKI